MRSLLAKMKSINKTHTREGFSGYFFDLSMAELLVARRALGPVKIRIRENELNFNRAHRAGKIHPREMPGNDDHTVAGEFSRCARCADIRS